MKRILTLAAIMVSFLMISCSSERKQEYMADTSIAADADMLDTIDTDTTGASSTTDKGGAVTDANKDTVN